jgi:hypothetical protein
MLKKKQLFTAKYGKINPFLHWTKIDAEIAFLQPP